MVQICSPSYSRGWNNSACVQEFKASPGNRVSNEKEEEFSIIETQVAWPSQSYRGPSERKTPHTGCSSSFQKGRKKSQKKDQEQNGSRLLDTNLESKKTKDQYSQNFSVFFLFFCLLCFVLFWFVWNRVSLVSSGWPPTHGAPPASASREQGLQQCLVSPNY